MPSYWALSTEMYTGVKESVEMYAGVKKNYSDSKNK